MVGELDLKGAVVEQVGRSAGSSSARSWRCLRQQPGKPDQIVGGSRATRGCASTASKNRSAISPIE
jgi:hypothetical protein